MIETAGSIWEFYGIDGFVCCIPTNGSCDSSGNAVMGAGLALQFKQRAPGVASELGKLLRRYGNEVHSIDEYRAKNFPTKHSWRDKTADLHLIAQSEEQLRHEALGAPEKIYVLPRVGCGNGTGNLSWQSVRPILLRLPENCWVVTPEGN